MDEASNLPFWERRSARTDCSGQRRARRDGEHSLKLAVVEHEALHRLQHCARVLLARVRDVGARRHQARLRSARLRPGHRWSINKNVHNASVLPKQLVAAKDLHRGCAGVRAREHAWFGEEQNAEA
jgi:hypothetical protein